MKKVLFMHTGSANHGCEALVRTTAKLLGGPEDVFLWSFCRDEDEKYGVSECVEKIFVSEQLSRFGFAYFEALFRRKILKQKSANMDVFLRNIFKDRIAISIGGDNYCYPWSAKYAIDLNNKIRKYAKASVLWGCSIDYEAITPEMEKDLAGYDLITARECITYETLKKINPNTVKVADPAFLLEKFDSELPDNFIEHNTVGINISPLIMKYGTDDNLIYENYKEMIDYIISETNMNICFIPHVLWSNNNDNETINILYDKYKSTNRVCKIEDRNCMELKGIISKCRFFVGARTHSTIAAYSTCVPTLVVGYSVKSRGIARDLFGSEEKYVLSVQKIEQQNELLKNFLWLMKNEEEICKTLECVIPNYISQAQSAMEYMNNIR